MNSAGKLYRLYPATGGNVKYADFKYFFKRTFTWLEVESPDLL